MLNEDTWTVVGQYALPWDMMAFGMACKRTSEYQKYPMPAKHLLVQAIKTGDERYIYDICRAHAAKVPDMHGLIGGLLKDGNLMKALSAVCPYICGPAWNLDSLSSYERELAEYIKKLGAAEEKIDTPLKLQIVGTSNVALGFTALSSITTSWSTYSQWPETQPSGHINTSRLTTEPRAVISASNSWCVTKNRAPDSLDLKVLHFADTVQPGEFTIGSQHYPLEVMFDSRGQPIGFAARINGYRCMIPLIFLPDF